MRILTFLWKIAHYKCKLPLLIIIIISVALPSVHHRKSCCSVLDSSELTNLIFGHAAHEVNSYNNLI